jgi:peptidoglycan lytic transglycosylase
MICRSPSRKIIACLRFAICGNVAKASALLISACMVCWSAQAAHATSSNGTDGVALRENVCVLTDSNLKIPRIVWQETSPAANEMFGVLSIVIDRLSEISLEITTYRLASLLARALEPERRAKGSVIVGTASMYNPLQPGYKEGGLETASGESYDVTAWSAAIQIDLRDRFGGVRYGKNYRPAYALVESAGKRAIVKINDVGPLRPGRVIDFNKRTMRYFDPSLQLGLIKNVQITPLPGDHWSPGPIKDEQLITVVSRLENLTGALQ